MKKIFLLMTTTLLFAACADEDFDINRDPDSLSAGGVALSTEMPAGIAGVAGGEGAIFALVGGFWSQYWTQSFASNQYKDIDNYSVSTVDYPQVWQAMYDALADIRNVKRNAEAQGNWNYYLMATVMKAYTFQVLVDFYDKVPYSEAFQGATNIQPHFDDGYAIYQGLLDELDTALNKDFDLSSNLVAGTTDLVFTAPDASWNIQPWIRFANTL